METRRGRFFGTGRSVAHPLLVERGEPDAGPILDDRPIAALLATLEIPAHGERTVVVILGQADDRKQAEAVIGKYQDVGAARAALAGTRRWWLSLMDTLQVQTNQPQFDRYLDWLKYQALAERIWARRGFYQASGAFGFRDQLQDSVNLIWMDPAVARRQILLHASQQFVEGDVVHWFHRLQDGRTGFVGRTHASDNLLWLAWGVVEYVGATGDDSLLDEMTPYLEAEQPFEPLPAGKHGIGFDPLRSPREDTVYRHGMKAIDLVLDQRMGSHGLPLMGTGDWNDGMNRVGEAGRGESVWLGWFLHATLTAFAPLATARGAGELAARWLARAGALRDALADAGWDGEWYRRGYFDDGTPLGSAGNAECAIDAIAQSWSVLSGAADPARAAQAMDALEARLIRRDDGLALLFAPPFDRSPVDPGYIKGYPPGIRENGGQYTHAATWSVLAFAQMGDGDRAAKLFALLNPVNHSRTRSGANRYRVEPYVVAADVYSVAPHVGRGGWTWYTGSAGWMYRAGLESILGLRRHGASFEVDPCVPASWPEYAITWRVGRTTYEIVVGNPDRVCRGVATAGMDGAPVDHRAIPLVDDGGVHRVRLVLGATG
jgi:cyclic beta-1,2-glucan synthetase